MTRVFITGIGAVTPIGNDVPTAWKNMVEGVSGGGKITGFDPEGRHTQVACEVDGFDPGQYMNKKEARRLARATQFAVAASKQALEHANFEVTDENCEDVGVMINTGGGGLAGMEEATRVLDSKGHRSVGPFLVPSIMPNAPSCLVSIETGATGPILTSVLACASGNYAFVEAFHMMQRGEAQVMITGGTESVISTVISAAFGRIKASSGRNDDPEGASRPFSGDRDGFVQGEGAVVMTLETEEHAKARGAKIYAEVLGGSLTGDAFHVTAPRPDGRGAIRTMRNAIKYAGLTPDDIDVIYAHGTSTPLNDEAETKALKEVFGERAYKIPISGTKSMVGHMLGAAGAISAFAAVMGFNDDVIPPTINLHTPDPACDLDYVPNVARQQRTNIAIINAFGFGGQNVALILKRYNGD
ncbi:MAG: beta-ketoacyl-ACP synthase II [Chloroflexota bacterium]